MKRNFKRIFVGSDSHCGHRAGLTPPEYQSRSGFGRWEQTQDMLWDFWGDKLSKWKPFDVAILNGDLVDGKGFRSGGSELITADRFIQAEIAYKAFREVGAPVVRIVFGTPYHSGMEEDFEIKCCDEFLKHDIDCKAEGKGFYNINGREFNVKHKVNGSTVHHGRATPIMKEVDANLFWADEDIEPRSNIVIRSHVHKSLYNEQDFRVGIITPALTALGDKYGSRQCSGVVEFGFYVIDVPDDIQEQMECHKEILPGRFQKIVSEVL